MGKYISKKFIFSQAKILIVDDLKIKRMVLQKTFKNAGFEHFFEAASGQEAIDMIIQIKPDLVLMDMHMPPMSGLEVCKYLFEHNLHDDKVIIMQSADDNNDDIKAQAFGAGVTDFISPPYDGKEAVFRALSHLERHFLGRKFDADYKRIQQELSEAAFLQKILLPPESILQDISCKSGLDINFYSEPVEELAGDYLTVRLLPDGKILIICADVSGHGISAALYAFSIHTLLDVVILKTQDPGEILNMLNNQLHELMAAGKFATVFLGIIDNANKTLSFSCAAAPTPIFLSGGKFITLDTSGSLLGAYNDSHFTTQTITFHENDLLFLFSDALYETTDKTTPALRYDEIEKIVLKNKDHSAQSLIDSTLREFYKRFPTQRKDDLSLLVCKFSSSNP